MGRKKKKRLGTSKKVHTNNAASKVIQAIIPRCDFTLFVQRVWRAGFICMSVCCPRSYCGGHCLPKTTKQPCLMHFCNAHLSLVVRGHPARLSVRRRHGHWLCWMQVGGYISLI